MRTASRNKKFGMERVEKHMFNVARLAERVQSFLELALSKMCSRMVRDCIVADQVQKIERANSAEPRHQVTEERTKAQFLQDSLSNIQERRRFLGLYQPETSRRRAVRSSQAWGGPGFSTPVTTRHCGQLRTCQPHNSRTTRRFPWRSRELPGGSTRRSILSGQSQRARLSDRPSKRREPRHRREY
jgi:hypothetical protein